MIGEYLKSLRMLTGITLRQFCLDAQLDPGNHSKVECGIMVPSIQHLDGVMTELGYDPHSVEYKVALTLKFAGSTMSQARALHKWLRDVSEGAE